VDPEQKKKLAELVSHPVQWQCNLARYTSFAIGGPAEAVVKVEKLRELQPLLAFLLEEDIPWRIIGKGTNVLVRDEGFPGVILRLGHDFTAMSEDQDVADSVIVRCGAGASLSVLSRTCSERGLTGLEFACGIPGTIGGAVIMNAGAWGKDIASVLRSVTLVTDDGELCLLSGEMDFAYRCCRTLTPYLARAVVAAVEIALQRAERDAILASCKSLQDMRKATQPSEYASAGSFFKNPAKDSAGRLIEASGLKGMRVGGAMVSLRHGNYLVNTGGATSSDVFQLMKIIQDTVKSKFGVSLEPEVHFI
jgi:UDP-N-acetylmuramate dehydrogenase